MTGVPGVDGVVEAAADVELGALPAEPVGVLAGEPPLHPTRPARSRVTHTARSTADLTLGASSPAMLPPVDPEDADDDQCRSGQQRGSEVTFVYASLVGAALSVDPHVGVVGQASRQMTGQMTGGR
jgi:hypothetical protein